MSRSSSIVILSIFALLASSLSAQPHLRIVLPERTRLLEDQRVDLVIEVRRADSVSGLRVSAGGLDLTPKFGEPRSADLDCDGMSDVVYRAELVSFTTPGWVRIEATATSSTGPIRDVRDVLIQPFKLPARPRNVIHYIGDGMSGAYRDAGRLVARSVETAPGVPGLREGFFDRLLEMDQMPISGMIIALGIDKVVPDSANTAHAMATGNKTIDGAFGMFGDGTDCAWLPASNASNFALAMDNPRIENLPEYLRRKFGYRLGIVTTSSVVDATPGAHGAHVGDRDGAFEVARQFLENPMLGGLPAADVFLGGGRESFDPDIRPDGRNLVVEFQAKGYHVVSTATELRGLEASDGKVLGLFRRATTVTLHSSGIRSSSAGHMNVAYDKLGLTRPGSEPLPEFGAWTDQPFLDAMTRKAIEILSGPTGNQPFFLMVEGASIDKQSHNGHVAGTIWDVIELDKAVGVGRAWAKMRKPADTLLVVSADHGQTMTILGIQEVSDADLTDRANGFNVNVNSPVGTHSTRVYRDVNANVRPMVPFGSSGSGRTGPPAEQYGDINNTVGFPDYMDADGDGYPENRQVAGKGRARLAVGFRTGNHAGLALPVTAEGPGAWLFTGYMDQSDIPLKIAATLGGDTSEGDAFVTNVLLNPRYPQTFGK